MTAEHRQALNDAANDLLVYVDEIWIIKDISDHIHKEFGIASPYLNFRDALFHYRKMYDAAIEGDNSGIIQQCACIEEHLNRGLKDFAVHLCVNFFIKILHEFTITRAKAIVPANLQKIRPIYHKIKNAVIDIRLEGMALRHFETHATPWLPKVVSPVQEFYTLLDANRSLKQLYVRFANAILNGFF
jgi:hypothetical protein